MCKGGIFSHHIISVGKLCTPTKIFVINSRKIHERECITKLQCYSLIVKSVFYKKCL
jgi:hypothetical protein